MIAIRGLFGAVLVIVLGLCADAIPVLAQSDRSAAENAALLQQAESFCRDHEARLVTSGARDSVARRLSRIAQCPEAGPPMLARIRNDPPKDSLRLRDLVRVSRELLDERVFRVALEVAGRRSEPRIVRLAALQVLWYYGDRTLVIFGTANLKAKPPGAVTGGGANSFKALIGSQPVVGDVRARIYRRMQELAEVVDEEYYLQLAFADVARQFAPR